MRKIRWTCGAKVTVMFLRNELRESRNRRHNYGDTAKPVEMHVNVLEQMRMTG